MATNETHWVGGATRGLGEERLLTQCGKKDDHCCGRRRRLRGVKGGEKTAIGRNDVTATTGSTYGGRMARPTSTIVGTYLIERRCRKCTCESDERKDEMIELLGKTAHFSCSSSGALDQHSSSAPHDRRWRGQRRRERDDGPGHPRPRLRHRRRHLHGRDAGDC